MQAFGYEIGMCPEAEKASAEVINLPTHPKINEYEVYRTLEFLKEMLLPDSRYIYPTYSAKPVITAEIWSQSAFQQPMRDYNRCHFPENRGELHFFLKGHTLMDGKIPY